MPGPLRRHQERRFRWSRNPFVALDVGQGISGHGTISGRDALFSRIKRRPQAEMTSSRMKTISGRPAKLCTLIRKRKPCLHRVRRRSIPQRVPDFLLEPWAALLARWEAGFRPANPAEVRLTITNRHWYGTDSPGPYRGGASDPPGSSCIPMGRGWAAPGGGLFGAAA
jgi:hypothetical protein